MKHPRSRWLVAPLTLVLLGASPDSGLVSGSLVGSVSSSVARDGLGEVSRLSARHGSSVVYDVEFTERDDLGRIVERVETVQGDAHTYRYSYSPAGRLTRVTRDGVEVRAYDYDTAGNITSATRDGVTTTAGTYDDQDRLPSWGAASFTHTPLGERASKTQAGQTTAYEWELGRLEAVDLPDGRRVTYLHDGFGRLIGRRVDGTLAGGFLWSGGRVVAQLDSAGDVAARFVYGTRAHVPDLVVKGGVTYRIVSDERGSPRLILNSSTGAVAQRVDFDAYGRVLEDTNPGFQPFGYAGGLTDPDTGLLLFGARHYDPETGRWLSRDGDGFSGGLNHYSYTEGDPINRIDPSGRSFIDCLQDIVGVAGWIPGVGVVFDTANALVYAARGKWGDAGLSLAGILLPGSLDTLGSIPRIGRGAPQTALYRAVSQAEADDIVQFGFRPHPGGLSMDTKLFTTTAENAVQIGRQLYKGQGEYFHVARVDVPRSLADGFYRFTDAGLPSVAVYSEQLSSLNRHGKRSLLDALPWWPKS